MRVKLSSRMKVYAVPLFTVGVALLLTLLLQPLLHPALFSFFYGAVTISAWAGGITAGLLATAISIIAINYFFIAPIYSLELTNLGSVVQLGAFVLVTLLISSLSAELRTAKQRLEKTLQKTRESEEQLRSLYQQTQEQADVLNGILTASVDHIYVFDRLGRYSYVSLAGAQVLGFQPDQVLGKTWRELKLPAELMEQVDTQRAQVMQTGQPVKGETDFAAADGTHYYEYILTPLQKSGQAIEAVVAVSRNITERKRVEVALRESQEIFQNFMRHSPATAFIKDEVGRYVYVNPLIERSFGRSFNEWVGKTDFDLFPAESAQQWRENDLKVLHEGRTLQVTETAPQEDGNHYYLAFKFPLQSSSGQRLMAGMAIDITEQKRAEQALRESEHRYAQILDSVQDLVFCKAAGSVVTYANKATCDYYGMTAQELRGITDVPFNQLDFTQQYLQDDLKVFTTGKTVEVLEEPNRRVDGEIHYFHTIKTPIFDTQGQVIELVGVSRDITERIWADAALRDSEARFRAVFESNMIGILFWNADGQFTDANDAFLQMVGYSREDLAQGKVRWDKMTPPEYHDLDQQALAEIAAHQVCIPYEKEYFCKDGRRLPVLLGGAALQGSADKGVCFVLDITERKQKEAERAQLLLLEQQARAEAELQRSYLHSLLMQAPAYICIHRGADHTFEFANPLYIQLIGDREVIGHPVREAFPDLEGQGFFELLDRVLATGEPYIGKEVSAHFDRYGNGTIEEGFFNFVYQPMQGLDGKPEGIMTFAFEVTDQVLARQQAEQLAEQSRRMNEELELRVKKRTEQLQATNKELEAFSYSVSHDLRAPLRHINGFVDLLQKRVGDSPTLDETSRRYLKTISDTTKEAGRLVDDLLAFSRMGRTEMRLTMLDLNQLLQEVQRDMQQDLESRTIDWRQISALPVVQADPTMMRLVLRNLLENAVKYTRPRPEAIIEISSTCTEDETIVCVRDNGVGFDMQYVHKLFGVFQRLHTNEQFEGTGIGLANVQRIIHRHGGKVWAQGELDRGAAFYFSLPNTPVKGVTWN